MDATVEHLTEIYLLPERGTNVFNRPIIRGATMTIQVPGRTISADEDLTGTSPGLEALRWTVIVRDGRACDFLGDGRLTERLVVRPEPTGAPRRRDRTASPRGGWWQARPSRSLAAGAYVLRRAR